MAKTLSGTYLSLKVFIPHGDTLAEQIETLTALQNAQSTGAYGPLLEKARVLEVRTDQRRMRFDDEQPVQDDQPVVDFVVDVDEAEPARRKRG
jgi:hypothetical protein